MRNLSSKLCKRLSVWELLFKLQMRQLQWQPLKTWYIVYFGLYSIAVLLCDKLHPTTSFHWIWSDYFFCIFVFWFFLDRLQPCRVLIEYSIGLVLQDYLINLSKFICGMEVPFPIPSFLYHFPEISYQKTKSITWWRVEARAVHLFDGKTVIKYKQKSYLVSDSLLVNNKVLKI